jgi:hypothetical protein
MTPFFTFFIGILGILMIGLARFVKFFGAPAPFSLVVAVVGLVFVIISIVAITFESRR